ncbi:DUF7662 domain-containing protein [Cryptosporangium aurantiacum]|uniref:DUF7662 domain-containing protein n=1 Tax=Cryptosporangium aurantiacum TaxID=134849 RepID=A0A1M7TU26_9ACTN|nr:hypothetical protein [Cryptosporangium aurantiacum]SHN74244.1 hypothetical protein SAMN05443668_10743 [Cryptosporangium aurantiacum]
MGKYDPLRRHLAAVPNDQQEIGLSLGEVEGLVGTLPPSARDYRAWWGNSGTSPQAAAWLAAGFVVDRVDLSGGRVAFVRRGRDDFRDPGGYRDPDAYREGFRPFENPDAGQSEAAVQAHLVAHLTRSGWEIQRVADTADSAATERGIDVVARQGHCTWAIEVKGSPRRSGTAAPGEQARHGYAAALLKAVLVRDAYPGYRVAIALPDVPSYRSLFERSRRSLDDLAVTMFFVTAGGHVTSTVSTAGGECG